MSTGNEEFKDIKRIEGADITSGLLERQLGFEKGNDSKFKMKYRPEGEQASSSISFTPDGGDPSFSTVEITTVMEDTADDKQATPKKYVDDKIADIEGRDPNFNGFVEPDIIGISFNTSTLVASISTRTEQSYYVKNKRYSFSGTLTCQLDASFNGRGYLFLKENGTYEFSNYWLEGYLPILSFNRNTSVSSSPEEQFLTITKDYHSTAMGTATKEYVNKYTGAWLQKGCEAKLVDGTLLRAEGLLVNEDVGYWIRPVDEVIPSIGYMTDATKGNEVFECAAPDLNWKANRKSWYQSIDEATGAATYGPGESNKGCWYLYFVRPDTRSYNWNDLVIPLDKSLSYDERYYDGLTQSVQQISEHYIDYIVNWKVLGLAFVQDGAIKDYVNIASFGVNDLLRGNLAISNLGAISKDAVIISNLQYSTTERLAIINGSKAAPSEASEIIGVGIGNNQVVVKGVANLLVQNRTSADTIYRAGTFVYRDNSNYSYGQIVSNQPGGVRLNDIRMPFVGVIAETTTEVVAKDAFVSVKVLVDVEKVMANSTGWTEIYNGPQKKFTQVGSWVPTILAETEGIWEGSPLTCGGVIKVECDLGPGGYGEAVFSFDSVGYDSTENTLIKLYDTTSISMGGSMISSIDMVHVGESPVGQKQYLVMTFNSPSQNADKVKVSVLSSYNIKASTEDLHSPSYSSYTLTDQKKVIDGKQDKIELGKANQILATNSSASGLEWVDSASTGGDLRGVGFNKPSAVQLNWSERESGPYNSKIGTLTLTITDDVVIQNSTSSFQLASGTNKSIEVGVTDFDQINGGECTLYVFMKMDGTLKLSLGWEKDLPSIAVIVADINADIPNGMNGFISNFIEVIHDIHGIDMSLSTREYMNVRGAHIHELLYIWTEKGDWSLYNRIACDGGVLVNDDVHHAIPSHANTNEGYVSASVMYLEKSNITNNKIAYRSYLPTQSFITNIFSPSESGIYAQVDNNGVIGKEYKNRALYVHVVRPDVRGDGYNHALVMTNVVPTGSQYATREQSEVYAEECKAAMKWVQENYSGLIFDWKIMGIVDVYKYSNTEAAIGYVQLKDTDLISLEFGDWERRVLKDTTGGLTVVTNDTEFKEAIAKGAGQIFVKASGVGINDRRYINVSGDVPALEQSVSVYGDEIQFVSCSFNSGNINFYNNVGTQGHGQQTITVKPNTIVRFRNVYKSIVLALQDSTAKVFYERLVDGATLTGAVQEYWDNTGGGSSGSTVSTPDILTNKEYSSAVSGTETINIPVAGYNHLEIDVSLKGISNSGNIKLRIDGESGLQYEEVWHEHNWSEWSNHTTPHGISWADSFTICGKPNTTEGYDSALATCKLQIKSGSDAGTYAPPAFTSEVRGYKDHTGGSEKSIRSIMGRFETLQPGYPEVNSISLLVSDIAAGSRIIVKGIK